MRAKKLLAMGLATLMMFGMSTTAFASEANLPILEGGTEAAAEYNQSRQSRMAGFDQEDEYGIMPLTSQAKPLSVPGGTLTSNAWRSSSATTSGNTYQWDYQVSAVYDGSKKVESIRTTWQGRASLRNSASFSLGLGDSVSAGSGTSWSYVNTDTKYWENSNGSKSSDYRSNMIVTPKSDYRSGTISITNTAKVKLKGYAKPYSISAGA